MSKKLKKKKEVNSLLKDLDIENMDTAQVQEEINKNENLLNQYVSKSKYPAAEKCNEKIEELKKILKQKKTNEIIKRHTLEKENLKIN